MKTAINICLFVLEIYWAQKNLKNTQKLCFAFVLVLFAEPDREVPPIYGLDGTDLKAWNYNVRDTAIEIIENILAGKQPNTQPLQKTDIVRSREGIFTCEMCSVTSVGEINHNGTTNTSAVWGSVVWVAMITMPFYGSFREAPLNPARFSNKCKSLMLYRRGGLEDSFAQ